MLSPQCKTLLRILFSACIFALEKSSVQNQYKPLQAVDLQLVPWLQEDDHHSDGPNKSTNQDRTQTHLGTQISRHHRSLGTTGINEFMERKTDCFQTSWLHMPRVIKPPAPSLLCLHCALLLIFFSPKSTKKTHFGVTIRQEINGDSSGHMETHNPEGWFLSWGWIYSWKVWGAETVPHGCPTAFSHKSVSPEQKNEEGTQLIILCGAIHFSVSWCIPWLVENHSWQTQNLPCCQKVQL